MLKLKFQSGNSARQAAIACACFVGAVLAGIVGSLLTTSWILSAQLHPWLYQLGLALLILAIPILILGGHCLDLMESDRKNRNRGVQD